MARVERSWLRRAGSVVALVAMLAAAPASAAGAAAPPKVPDQVAAVFRFGDFDELERLYAVYGRPGERSPLTGAERLKHFWMGIGQIADSGLEVTEGYYVQMDALTRQWAEQRPQSVLAQLLHANSLRVHAWYHRGHGYAQSVSPASWAAFEKHLNLALEQLRRSEALAARDSSWNRLMMDVGLTLGWRIDQLRPLYEAGIAKNPDHDELHFTMQTALLPKWGGDLPTVERFIATVTEQTRSKRGLEMYARMYASLSYQQVQQTLFTATRVSWPLMKSGFEDQLSRHPHSDHRNMYAYFACMARDRPALQEQLRLMDGAFERSFWGSTPERTFEACQALARQL